MIRLPKRISIAKARAYATRPDSVRIMVALLCELRARRYAPSHSVKAKKNISVASVNVIGIWIF
jgi:hypothetical protein